MGIGMATSYFILEMCVLTMGEQPDHSLSQLLFIVEKRIAFSLSQTSLIWESLLVI